MRFWFLIIYFQGGITGIALIINYIANIPVGMMVLILNIPLFIIGLRKIDKEFIIYSLIGTSAFSILVSSINTITNTIHINDTMLSAIAGGVSGGIGIGIVFRSRGSMGGSDIVSWILYRKWGISVAAFSFMVNIAVILGGVLFNGASIEIVLYTLISMYTSSVVINKVIEGLNRRKLLLIITNEKERVSKALMIYLCKFINWESSASIAGLIFISIMVGLKGETAWIYSMHRLLDTIIGIAITTLVNTIAFSINMYSTIMKSIEITYSELLKTVKNKVCLNLEVSTEKLVERVKSIQDFIKIYKEQLDFKKSKGPNLQQLNLLYENLQGVLEELKMIDTLGEACMPNDENAEMITHMFDCSKNYDSYTAGEKNIVYNFHLERLLKGIRTIQQNIKK